MSIVHQLDKRSGITYVYESTSYWDKEKKQARSHRKLIGRLDPETGKVLPTDGRGHKRGHKIIDTPVPNDRLLFNKQLDALKEEILSGHRVAEHERFILF